MKGLSLALIVLVFLVVPYFTLTLFVIPPIGAVPEGRTVIIWKRAKTNFIDSPDALCAREMGGVSLLCRAAALGGIAQGGEDGILMRLPYSEWLYLISTNGKTYQ